MKLCKVLFVFVNIFILSFVFAFTIDAAYYNQSYLTMKIPNGYYSNVDDTLSGKAFRSSLYEAIKDANIGGYSSQNTTLKYSDPDKDKDGNIICFYTGRSLESGWNKEHVWAKSHGIASFGTSMAYSDPHHLRPTLNSINSSRGNSDFAEINDSNCSSDAYGNKWTSSLFEPRDEVKGDVARIMFYMATKYGSDTKYGLTLVEDLHTSANTPYFGNLKTLLKWHEQDPVSESEIYRNNAIYDIQGNRNPYIDHPEYVSLAFGNPDDYKENPDPAPTPNPNPTPTPNPNPEVSDVEGDIHLEFKGTPNTSYTTNFSFTKGGFNFSCNLGGAFNGYPRIGHNKIDAVEDFIVSFKETTLQLDNVVNDIIRVKYQFADYYGSGLENYYIYIKNESGLTEVAKGELNSNLLVIEHQFANPISGNIILVLTGSSGKVRADLVSFDLSVKKEEQKEEPIIENPEVNPFTQEKCEVSLMAYKSKNTTLDKLDIRFGGIIKEDLYDSNCKYGVLVLADETNIDVTNINLEDYVGYYKEITPVKVSGGYQFGWVIDNVSDYDFKFKAYLYKIEDGKIYLSQSVTSSMNDCVSEYLSYDIEEYIKELLLEYVTR